MNKEEFRKFHRVDFLNFQKYLESIGFKRFGLYVYTYNEYTINIYAKYCRYDFYNGSKWVVCIEFYDLTPLKNEFKKELRSLKLKQILK